MGVCRSAQRCCSRSRGRWLYFFFFQAEDGIRDVAVTGVQTCALPICADAPAHAELDALAPRPPDVLEEHARRPRRRNREDVVAHVGPEAGEVDGEPGERTRLRAELPAPRRHGVERRGGGGAPPGAPGPRAPARAPARAGSGGPATPPPAFGQAAPPAPG